MFRTLLLLLAGNALNGLILLMRNLLLARLVSVENYGIAMTFAMGVAVIEMTSTIGLQKQLVQHGRGNDPHFQAALQGFQVIRGVFNCLVMLVLAGPFASFLGVPQVTWAHQVLASVLLMTGLMHFDPDRLSRTLSFRPAMMVAIVPPLVAVGVIWPLAMIFNDYRVMLWSMIAQYASIMIVSHLAAERPYRLAFDRQIIRQSMKFGWPLLLDGALVFVLMNGEKMIVGQSLGMEALAMFTMAVTLTLTPGLIFLRVGQSFFLPQIAAAPDETSFRRTSDAALQAHLACGGFLVVSILILGGPFIHLVVGEKYAPVIQILPLMAVIQALYTFKGAPGVIAMARGRTSNGMISNIVRAAFMPLAWGVVAWTGEMLPVIWIGIGAQLLSYLVSLWLLRRQTGLPLRPQILPLISTGVLLAFGCLGPQLQQTYPVATDIVAVALFVMSVATMGALRRYLTERRMIRHAD